MSTDREIVAEQIARIVGSGAPDCRPKDQRGQIRTPHGLATPVFCANCGMPNGFAYVDTSHIFYLCNDCEEKHGLLDLPTVDEDYVRGRKEQ